MTTLPEEAVKAAMDAFHLAWNNNQGLDNELPAYAHRAALTAALPFLPVQGAVKKLEWENSAAQTQFGEYTIVFDEDEEMHETPYCAFSPNDNIGHYENEEAAKAAAQADYEARILSAIEAASPLSKLKAGNARLEDQLAETRKALDGLLKPFEGDDCRYDHHGYCQAHFLQEVDECCVKIARRVLEGGEGND